jgi:hypothetical protein
MAPNAADRNREFWLAILRLLFGVLQIAGATCSLIFLIQIGASWLTAAAVG